MSDLDETFEEWLRHLGELERGLSELCQRRLEPVGLDEDRHLILLRSVASMDDTERSLLLDKENRALLDKAAGDSWNVKLDLKIGIYRCKELG